MGELANRDIDRRTVLRGIGAAGLMQAAGLSPGQAAPKRHFRNALSVSPFTDMLFAGGMTYTDGKLTAHNTAELQRLYMAHGATEIFARIGTLRTFKPGDGDHSVERGLERAKLAKSLDLPFNPELGLFASYGDVLSQPGPDFSGYSSIKLPRPWAALSIKEMAAAMREYGALIAAEIVATGAKVNVWDIGNEVEFGSAGVAINSHKPDYRAPDGVNPAIGKVGLIQMMQMSERDRIAWLRKTLWPHLGRLFAAVADGVRSVDKSARFSTHISGVGMKSPRLAVAFFEAMGEAGYEPDQLGGSYYPSSDPDKPDVPDRVARLKETVSALNERLRRKVFLAEFGYPGSKQLQYGGGKWLNAVKGYPLKPEGQARFIRDFAEWGAGSGHLSGMRPWAPGLILPVWNAMALFELRGRRAIARPGLDAIAEGAARV